ncbi:MAG: efflux RND transporter periplasmic adaptor subunit [Bacteroidota bacterium]
MTILMKTIRNYFLPVIILIALFFYSCGGSEETKENNSMNNVNDTIPVQTAKVELKDLKISKTFSGTLEGEEQANIVAKIPERITAIKIRVGESVKTGQLLVELDKSGASSQYYQAEAGYLNAGRDLERMKALYTEGAISQQMLDGVQTQYNIAKANFEAAKSTVELVTPISGVVTAINANVGDLANPGIPIVVVANISSLKAIFSVGEGDISNFAVGQPTEIYSELKPALIQKGRIQQISKSADIQSRSFEIKSIFSNTYDRWFKPGMFCRVKVELKSQKGSLLIPNLAIVNNPDSKGVFVVENSKAVYKVIQTGLTDGTFTEVISGLSAGETIATIGMNNLKDGSFVFVSKKDL